MESVHIRSFSSSYFPAFGLNTGQKNSKYEHFSSSVSPLHFGTLEVYLTTTQKVVD